jgi:hypothetical protein
MEKSNRDVGRIPRYCTAVFARTALARVFESLRGQ